MDTQLKRKQNIFVLRVSANAHNPLVAMLSEGVTLLTVSEREFEGDYLLGSRTVERLKCLRPFNASKSREVPKEHFIFYLPPLRGKSLRSRGRGVNHD